MTTVLAVDIGGTKLAAGLVSDSGELRHAAQVPSRAVDGAELYAALVGLVRSVLEAGRRAGGESPVVVGVGSGGPMAAGGQTVSPLNIPQWRQFPLRSRLADDLSLPVFVDNDAKALALGEGWCGAAVGERDYLAMVVSTGVGAGLVVDGQLLDGASGNAGHLGHLVVVPDGLPCACGSRGCLEAEASGTGIAARLGRPATDAPPEEVERAGELVGRAVAAAVVLLDLRLACVAGSVALGFGRPFFEAVNAALGASARIEYARGARIVPAGLGAAGPLVGAAAVGLRGLHGPTLRP